MINIKSKSKVNIHWKVSPYDYSAEMMENISRKFAKKYGMQLNKVKVIPEFITIDSKGNELSITKDIIGNIQDPLFQEELFKEYLTVRNIKGYDFDYLKKIDSELNSRINYQDMKSHQRYSLKWIRWSNFLSYGKDNYFDFTTLNGLVLLRGEPANQSGKTTFAIDLMHFLLFGKTSKAATQDKIFNRFLKSETSVEVEGCISIDNEDYVIKRTLLRPSITKRTDKSKTTQKVEYYRIVGSSMEELEDYVDEQQAENSIKTNKIIKESIGRESDFDLIMSVTESTLDDLVNKKEAERGRLLARWIGLLPIEEKEALAREKYNGEVKPYMLSNQYNEEKLSQEIDAFNLTIKSYNESYSKCESENKVIEKEISSMEEMKKVLLESKQAVDETLLKLDITTFDRNMQRVVSDGKSKNEELSSINARIKEIGNVDFSVDEYDKIVSEHLDKTALRATLIERYQGMKQNLEHLRKSEICPTCGRKFDNIDNSAKIKEIEESITSIETEGKKLKSEIDALADSIEKMKVNRDKYNEKSKLDVKKSAIEVNIEKLRSEYMEMNSTRKEYIKNKEAIDKNNETDIKIRNAEVSIISKRTAHQTNIEAMARYKSDIEAYNEQIKNRREIISKLREEADINRNWKIYLDMIGKDGISKMVLRKALPIINARLSDMLSDVCDFDVEVGITDKNDVVFYLIKDGIRSDLSSGSGFELTASALALRAVLADMSTIPRCSILILDEIWGRVAKSNHDNMRNLIEKISKDYSAVFLITHLDEVKEWCDTTIVVKKENNVSTISRL